MKPIERVLVIDDDETAAFLTKRVLSSFVISEHIQSARNGAEGLAHMREAAERELLPQLVLLDIKMPFMDAFTFMEELAMLDLNLTGTKIVLLSSSHSPWDKNKAAESPAAAFIHRPLTEEVLRGIME